MPDESANPDVQAETTPEQHLPAQLLTEGVTCPACQDLMRVLRGHLERMGEPIRFARLDGQMLADAAKSVRLQNEAREQARALGRYDEPPQEPA